MSKPCSKCNFCTGYPSEDECEATCSFCWAPERAAGGFRRNGASDVFCINKAECDSRGPGGYTTKPKR